MTDRPEVEAALAAAAAWFEASVAAVPAAAFETPGLGTWTVRELVGHTLRALVTVEEYLAGPEAGDAPPDDDPVGAAGRYYHGTADNPRLHAAVAERGRQAGAELGADPAAAVAGRSARVRRLVAEAGPGSFFVTRFGPVGFTAYLCTRTTELVVHTVDLQVALGRPAEPPPAAGRLTHAVLGEVAAARGQAAEVLRALTGRGRLPDGFSLVG